MIQYVFGFVQIRIGDFANVGTGGSNGNEAIAGGKYPFYIRSQTVKTKDDYEFDEEAIIIPGEGGVGDIFHYQNGKYALHQRAYRINFISDSFDTKYAYYYMTAFFKKFINRKSVNATVRSIRKPMIEDFEIALPSIEEQKRIVEILDRFDKLCNDLSEGLPAEIEYRQRQYGWYRDSLLNFYLKFC